MTEEEPTFTLKWSRSDQEGSEFPRSVECFHLDPRTLVARVINVLRQADSVTIYALTKEAPKRPAESGVINRDPWEFL